MTDGRRGPHRIDVHAHYLAPAYKQALQEAEMWLIGGIPVPDWTPELALEFMDAHGIAVQMLSVSDPGVEFVDHERAPALARECNDYAAAVVHEHPGRFGAFAVLPMSDVEQARAETVRALDDLRLDGVGLLSSYDGRYPGDPAFEPLLSELNRRHAWVMVHPAVHRRRAQARPVSARLHRRVPVRHDPRVHLSPRQRSVRDRPAHPLAVRARRRHPPDAARAPGRRLGGRQGARPVPGPARRLLSAHGGQRPQGARSDPSTTRR